MYCQKIVESTGFEMHLSIKLRGMLRPKSVRRTLVIGLKHMDREQICSLTSLSESSGLG